MQGVKIRNINLVPLAVPRDHTLLSCSLDIQRLIKRDGTPSRTRVDCPHGEVGDVFDWRATRGVGLVLFAVQAEHADVLARHPQVADQIEVVQLVLSIFPFIDAFPQHTLDEPSIGVSLVLALVSFSEASNMGGFLWSQEVSR